jgi:hypothetical protein|tara:strand:- start:63 stop:320 length:258 start_codon:yes stop_codon:yes gene_type:complete
MESEQTEIKKVVVPEGAELIDDVFYVWKTRYSLYSSMTKQGRKMMTGGTKDGVTELTRWHLKCEQDGTLEQYTRVVGDAFVGGKL